MRIRTALLLALVVFLLAFATACSPGTEDASQTQAEDSASSAESVPATIEEYRTAVEEQYGGEPWWPRIVEIREVTVLGAPTIWIVTDIISDETDASATEQAITDALTSYDLEFAHNYELRGFTGGSIQSPASLGGSSWGGTPMTEAYDLPPAAQSAEEITAWLDTVFGEGGLIVLGPTETWYASITNIELIADPYGNGDVLRVHTTFANDDSVAEMEQIELLKKGLLVTGSPLLSYVELLGAGDVNMSGISFGGPFQVGDPTLQY